MWTLVARRLLIGVFTVLSVSVIIFLATKVLPGDAADIRLGQSATAENLQAMRERLGLDQPYLIQYWRWLSGILSGDLGYSLAGDRPISELVASRYHNTLVVSVFTTAIVVPLSLALGIVAAMFPGSLYDRLLTIGAVATVAAPDFFVAMLLVIFFVMWLGVGSAVVIGNTDGMTPTHLLSHFALPVAALCISLSSQLIRMTRAAVLNVMSSPYIEMAILKGVPRSRIVMRHALPNAIGPIVNIIALSLAYLISSVVVIEVFFGYQGLAVLMVQGVQTRDFVLVQSLGMLFCAVYVGLMLIADVCSILANPRLRHPK
ncbi:ABC transporter permease [Rhodobacteraceae bacterium KMM 6894]|nr:ABC transporter permease [Rhodobacteraceae bacterium KMM 6894]